MAESTESAPSGDLIQAGESRNDASSRLLREAMQGDQADKPDDSNAEPMREIDQAADDDAQDDGEIRTDDLGIKKPLSDGGDTTESLAALSDLAEKAGVKLEDVYKLEIGFGDGRPSATLGAIKDAYIESSELAEMRGTFEDHRSNFENDMLRARAELTTIIKLLPELPEGIAQQAQQVNADTEAREMTALHDIKPEWKDPATYHRARELMIETVAAYGFSRAEMMEIKDHRAIKMIWDHHQQAKRISEANASRKKLVRDHKTPRSTSRTPPVDSKQRTDAEQAEVGKSGTPAEKTAASHELLFPNQVRQ